MSAETNNHNSNGNIQLPMFGSGETAAQIAEARLRRYRAGAAKVMVSRTVDNSPKAGDYDAQIDHMDHGLGGSIPESTRMAEPVRVADLPNEGANRARQVREQRKAAGKPVGKPQTVTERRIADKAVRAHYPHNEPTNQAEVIDEPMPLNPATEAQFQAFQQATQPRPSVDSAAAEAFAASEGYPSRGGIERPVIEPGDLAHPDPKP